MEARLSASPEKMSTSLRVAVNILRKWGMTTEQMTTILGVSSASINRVKNKSVISLTRDQLERISYVLNIHAALKLVFDNPENTYNFVNMANHNPYFNGATPMSIMLNGSMASLYETHKRIDALRGAGW